MTLRALVAMIVVAWPAIAAAQAPRLESISTLPHLGPALPNLSAPLTPLGSAPLAPIAAPLPPIGLPPVAHRVFDRHRSPIFDHGKPVHHGHRAPTVVVFVPVAFGPYGGYSGYGPWGAPPPQPQPAPPPVTIVVETRERESRPRETSPAAEPAPPAPPAALAPPLAPAPPTTMYLIPGCYVGNVHPARLKLPAGCDLDRLVIREPEVAAPRP